MRLLAINMVLALVWIALTDSFTLSGLVVGFLLGLFALWMAQPLFGETGTYFVGLVRIALLIVYFLKELVLSSIRVAWAVITPNRNISPRILEMPLDVKSDLEILLVANLITLTPGTLTLDVSEDRSRLYVHAMFAEDPTAEILALKQGMEYMVRRVFVT